MLFRRICVQRTALATTATAMNAVRFNTRGRRPSEEEIRRAQAEHRARTQEQMMQQQGGRQSQPPRGPPSRQAPPEEQPEEDNIPPPEKPTDPKFTKCEVREDRVAVLKMCRPPVNSLHLEMLEELTSWFLWLSTEESGCNAIVLTSEIKTVFSAGLDINELSKPQPERFQQFWYAFQEIWLVMNTFPKPIIACINGNSPAGGCILSLCADYRVMARASLKDPQNPKAYRIGLNECKLGIVAPPWVMRSLSYVVGERKAERMLQLGETPTADEALAWGLVDKVVEETDIDAAAIKEALAFAAIPQTARMLTKDLSRQHLTSFFREDEARRYDEEFFSNLVQNPEVAENLEKYLARLSKK